MKLHLHFVVILIAGLPVFVYSQSESRREGATSTSDSRYGESSTLYLDSRRRIEPLDRYTGPPERIAPFGRRSLRYLEDGFEFERPPYIPSLRRRRPIPRISPLGRRYGRRLRRPSLPPRRRRLRLRFGRRRPFYDPYFREFEPPRRDRRYRRRRRLRSRPRYLRPRGPRRRGSREYYSRDRDDDSIDDVRIERSSSPSRESRLEDESYVRRRRRLFDRPRRVEPSERILRRRGGPIRDRRVAFTEERRYADERLRSPPRRSGMGARTVYEEDSYLDERLPYERLSDRGRTERVLPRYSLRVEPRTMAPYRPSQRRETEFRSTDQFDINNSVDELSPLRSRPPRDDVYNSTTIYRSVRHNYKVTERTPGENNEQTLSNVVENDFISQADGFLDKPKSNRIDSQRANLETFVSKRLNTKLSSTTNDLANKNMQPKSLGETVQHNSSPIEMIGESLNQKRSISPEKSIDKTNIVKVIDSTVPSLPTSRETNSVVGSDTQQKKPKRIIGSANVLSRKHHPDFFIIPLPIPQSSFVVDLSVKSESETTQTPIDAATTEQLKLNVFNNSVPAVNEDVNVNAKTDKTIKPVIETGAITHKTLGNHIRPIALPKETRRSTAKASRDDLSVSEKSMHLSDIPMEADPPALPSRRVSPGREYIDKIPITDGDILNRERFLREDPSSVRRRSYRDEIMPSEDKTLPFKSPIRSEKRILLRRRRPVRRMSEEGTLSSERPYGDDIRARRRRVLSPEILPIRGDTALSNDRPLGGEMPFTRRRRLPLRYFEEDTSRRRDERRFEAEITGERRRFPPSDRELPEISPPRVTRRLLREDGGRLGPAEISYRDEIPVRRRDLTSPDERLRDIPREEVIERRRRPPSTEERLQEISRDEASTRRRRFPDAEERLIGISREVEPVRRRRPSSSEERRQEMSRDEAPARHRRPPPSEERLREMSRDEAQARRRRFPPAEERVRDVFSRDRLFRRRRLDGRLREVPRQELPGRRRRISPLEGRFRDLPPDDEPIRLRRPQTLEVGSRDVPTMGEPMRRRRRPSKERFRDMPILEESVRRRLPRPLKERPSVSPEDESMRRRRLSPPEDRIRGRRLLIRERPRRREYAPSRRRTFPSDRLRREGRRPRIQESFADEPVISRRRLRPRARPRTQRLEIDDLHVTGTNPDDRDSDIQGTSVSTDEATSTLAPMESVTERLRLGAVRARGGEDGFPVHGGYCAGERCSDGGLEAGVQNGTGTGTLQLFLERKRTGTNEDIAEYERDLRPRRTRTTLVV